MTARIDSALTIAGLDPSGGAGAIADLRAFDAVGVYGAAVITALTVQDSHGVKAVETVDSELLGSQLDLLSDDLDIACAKTGLITEVPTVRVIAERAGRFGALVVDPVFASSSGFVFAEAETIAAVIEILLPLCQLVTPNTHEAQIISGVLVESIEQAAEAAEAIRRLGAASVCVTGGHQEEGPVDVFVDDNGTRLFRSSEIRLEGGFHGTGCLFSAFATAYIALGNPPQAAVEAAHRDTHAAINRAVQPGKGSNIPWPRPA